MRLALFTDSLEPSGVGRVIETLVRHLPRHRYTTFLVCAEGAGADGLADRIFSAHVAEVVRCTVRCDDDLPALHKLVEQLRAWDVDIFHNHIGATWEGDWGTLAARCAGVPLVVATEHLPNVLQIPHELEHRRSLNQLLHRIFTVSDSVRRSLIAAELAPADQVLTVENGIEPPAGSHGRNQAQARRELDLPEDTPVVLFLGRLVEQKDPAVLLQAVSRLVAAGEHVLALFAGDGPLRGELERNVERLRLRAHVGLLGNRGDVGRLLAAADALAMPSRFEGLPLAVLEAMSMGLPVVGCDAPGVRDAVEHGVTGWLAPIGDGEAFERGLRLALSPEPGRRWGKAAKARYEQRFTAQHMVERHDHQYVKALSRLAPERLWKAAPGSGLRAPGAAGWAAKAGASAGCALGKATLYAGRRTVEEGGS